jgi:hypothetical protein
MTRTPGLKATTVSVFAQSRLVKMSTSMPRCARLAAICRT